MAGRSFTLSTKNLAQVQNGLRRYGQQALVRAKGVVQESADRTYAIAQDLCPRDTGFMAEHMRETISDSGFGYEVGFREEDFAAAGLEFYPIFTEWGTSRMAAQPCIFPAAATERPRFKRALAEALRPSRGAAPTSRR
jgi:HK97 gp10 family phage protein